MKSKPSPIWPVVPISDVCDVFDGPHATPIKTNCGPIYLGIDAITSDGHLFPAGYNYLSPEDFLGNI